MASLLEIIKMIFVLALLILAGYILTKRKRISSSGRKTLTSVVLDFFLPCSILKSFIGVDISALKSCLMIFLMSWANLLISFLLGKTFKGEREKRAIEMHGLICANSSFMGNPLVNAVYGAPGLVLWAIYMLPYRIVMWTYGLALFTKAPDTKTLLKKLATNPCLLLTAAGVLMMLTHLTLPQPFMTTLTYAGNCVTGITMVVIGSILADSKGKNIFSLMTMRWCAVRLLVIPALVFAVCRIVHAEPLVTCIATLLSSMPCATNTAMFADQYDYGADHAASLTISSTVLCPITIGAILIVLSSVFPGL